MPEPLDGRVAMVTGAGQGIGAAIAARLSKMGACVAVCDIDGVTASATARSLERAGVGLQVDVSDRAAVVATVARIGDELGPIDILVNNAGIDVVEPFMDSTEEVWDRLWQVNLKGQIICCHAVLDAYMIPSARGRIVNLGSDAGRVGSTGEAVYSATKGGVIAFTKTLAREMARSGITVNCVCPGPTNTALLAQTGDDPTTGLRAALAKAIPLRRAGRAGRHRGSGGVPRHRRCRVHDRADRVGERRADDVLRSGLAGRHSLVGPVKVGSRLSRTAAIPSTASGPPNP